MELYSVILGMTTLQWEEYLGLMIIPVVSSKDTIFMKIIFEKSYDVYSQKPRITYLKPFEAIPNFASSN